MSYRSSGYRSHPSAASSSSSSSTVASRKANTERNQQILKTLAKHSSNKNCSDCKTATNPRWASWNIGVFICIRCSGIHRSMGTHISKVKSIDLDSWTDEQVQSMVNWGNAKANSYWEHNLPKNHVPDDSKIQNFIRTKYELKKWVATKYIPDPKTISVASGDATAPSILQNGSSTATNSTTASKPLPASRKGHNNDLLSDIATTTSTTPSKTSDLNTKPLPNLSVKQQQQQQQQQQPQQPQQQHTLQSTPLKSQSASSSLLDLNFGPSPSVNTTGGSGTSVSSTQPAINSGRSSRPDLKKSILALYSTPSTYNKPASAITPNATNNINNLFGQPSAPPTYQSSASLGGLNNSLAGLNLAGGSNNTPSNFAANTSSANIWGSSSTGTGSGSSSTTSNSNINNKTPLDDDLFKNVWS